MLHKASHHPAIVQSSAAQPAPCGSNQHCTVNCAKLCCEVHCTFVQCIKNLHSVVSKHLSFPMLHTSFCTCALHTILILRFNLYCIILQYCLALLLAIICRLCKILLQFVCYWPNQKNKKCIPSFQELRQFFQGMVPLTLGIEDTPASEKAGM